MNLLKWTLCIKNSRFTVYKIIKYERVSAKNPFLKRRYKPKWPENKGNGTLTNRKKFFGKTSSNLNYLQLANTESKLQVSLQKVVKKIEHKGVNINWMKTQWMVVSNRNNPRCKLQIGDETPKPSKNNISKYLGSALTEGRKCKREKSEGALE